MTGHRAEMPPPGWKAAAGTTEGWHLRVVEESTGAEMVFDCERWALAPTLRRELMDALATVSGPSGRQRALATVERTFRAVHRSAQRLNQMGYAPNSLRELTPSMVNQLRLAAPRDFEALRGLIRKHRNLPAKTAASLMVSAKPKNSGGGASFSKAQFQRIMAEARRDLRRARDRIEDSYALVARFRAGEIERGTDEWRFARHLDVVERTGDVPRYEGDRRWMWIKGNARPFSDYLCAFDLTADELVSVGILLVGLTGQNQTPVSNLTVEHQRADGYVDGATPVAIVDFDKARRGWRRRYMTTPLTGVPDWVMRTARDTGDGLNTAFGVYSTVAALTERGRVAAGTNRLLVARAITGGGGRGRHWIVGLSDKGITPRWLAAHNLDLPLTVNWDRLRLTHTRLHQRGIAHTDATLVDAYLRRDRAAYVEYQRLVAEVLADQVQDAKAHGVGFSISDADIAEFETAPGVVAARFELSVDRLTAIVQGRRDTVLTACADELDSPFTPAGSPCEASFFLCLACRNAIALPANRPAQITAYDALAARRTTMPPHEWVRRFGLAYARLSDILGTLDEFQIDRARRDATDGTRDMVERLVAGHLEVS